MLFIKVVEDVGLLVIDLLDTEVVFIWHFAMVLLFDDVDDFALLVLSLLQDGLTVLFFPVYLLLELIFELELLFGVLKSSLRILISLARGWSLLDILVYGSTKLLTITDTRWRTVVGNFRKSSVKGLSSIIILIGLSHVWSKSRVRKRFSKLVD